LATLKGSIKSDANGVDEERRQARSYIAKEKTLREAKPINNDLDVEALAKVIEKPERRSLFKY